MSHTLFVPIHLDALCLAENTRSAKALADYRKLPYVYQNETHQMGTPNVSETVLPPLFNEELILGAGIHIHWSLPDALTRGIQSNTGTAFPIVPNRWLILRQGGDKGNKQWIVESDYLYPENLAEADEPANTINILVERPDPETQEYQRYRYMGRTIELSNWSSDDPTDEYIKTLTAIGPKADVPLFDPIQATFAAFYPNCQSVFGFYDSEYPKTNPPDRLQYDVIGWYSNEQQDCLQIFLQNNQDLNAQELLEQLQEEFRWTFELNGEFPQRSLYYGRVTFATAGRAMVAGDRISSLSDPTIAVGNSAPEALSAYLAHSYNSETNPEGEQIRQAVEEQLEALQLSERLESRKLDLDAKLREVRHEQGFGTRSAGVLWLIQPQVSSSGSLTDRTEPIEVKLPLELAHQLNEVNRLQEEYNQALANIESQRQQLYTYWHEFMTNLYVEGGNDAIYEDVADKFLNPLRQTLLKIGRLELDDEAVQLRAEATNLIFGLYSKFDRDNFEFAVTSLNSAIQGDFEWWAYTIGLEFQELKIQLPNQPVVRAVITDQKWEIEGEEQIYTITIDAQSVNLEIPAVNSQLAHQVATAINILVEAIATYNSTAQTQYSLKQFPSERYWQPNDPVILLAGEAAKVSTRHGQDGRLRSDKRLDCHLITETLDLQTLPSATISSLQSKIESLEPEPGTEAIGFNTWTQAPWSPFLMRWGVQLFPCRTGAQTDYASDVILNNYELVHNAIDLSLIEGKESSFLDSVNTYDGMSILTPSAGIILQERVTTYLNEQILRSYYNDLKIPESEQTEDYLSQNYEAVKTWYNEQIANLTPLEKAQDPGNIAFYTYEQMLTLDCQAQALSGFNDTLLLYKPTFYLEIDDPISTDDTKKKFHDRVRWTLGRSLQYEILGLDCFNPIRSGAMKITTLSLVDTFGQVKEIVETGMETDVVTTTSMTPPNLNYQILLPPRLCQPARLNFHWLAGDRQKEEQMTVAPAVTPVCGWIVPNNLDSNLQFYDADGHAVGLIDRAGTWRWASGIAANPAENYPNPEYRPNLANSHLQKVVHYLLERGMGFQQEFISTLINSLDTIDPENFAEHPSLALLVGRPIALVRATFNLEVRGLPASDPTVSAADIETTENEHGITTPIANTGGFGDVKFRIRLGDYQQLNDGLVGFWREVDEGEDYNYEGNIFYAPQSRLTNNEFIQTEAEGIVYFEQTVDAPPQYVTMLIDPRGTIHTTSGILPNQELRLPPENYNEALQAIEVNLISAPILSNQQEIRIPLPEVPQYAWSWLSLTGSEWSETEEIKPVNVKATFDAPQKLYEGWLQLTPVEDGES